ncbi:hypothetical protein [Mesonia aestuariivivens]|uniref:Uncharacterized protein n=1 Tax=Mesonia aestuariivivens TaxID=2796128 RepID=A0ABS6W358_9FLAO|nr:hypothetical protein [Mesonia aestuariivivens]MBW2962292.1 hypothetical protein [Mesonia aestuariivivens]
MEETFRIGWIIFWAGVVGYVLGLVHISFSGINGIPKYKSPPPPPKPIKTNNLPNVKNSYIENGWLCFELINGDRIRLNFNDLEALNKVIKRCDHKFEQIHHQDES